MAVTVKSSKTQMQMKDYDRKTLCTYNGVDPNKTPNSYGLFANSVAALSTSDIEYVYLVITNELIDSI